MTLKDQTFEPHQVHGNAGQQVIIELEADGNDHTFTVPAIGLDIKVPAKGKVTASFVMPTEGIFPFYCKIHGSPTSGMHGQLVFH